MRPFSALYLIYSLVVVLALAFAGTAHAQRAPRAKATAGLKVKKWNANGVKMEHRTHGTSKIGWERRATGKNGITSITGKLWGNVIRGVSMRFKDGRTVESTTATSATGVKRRTVTTTAKNGTERKAIDMADQGTTRSITTWRAGNTQFVHTRDTDTKTGEVKSTRMGYKAPK